MGQSFWARSQHAAWLMTGFCLMWYGGTFVEAGSLYVYTDAQGQPVLTDNLQLVPAEYRAGIRVMTGAQSVPTGATRPGAESAASSPLPTSGVVGEILHAVAQKVSSRPIEGLTPHQTAVVIVAGICWIALLLFMYFSSNPAIRLICKCFLMLVGLAAVYHLTVGGPRSDGSVGGSAPQTTGQAMDLMGQVKTKTEQNYRLQEERTTRQLDLAEQPTP